MKEQQGFITNYLTNIILRPHREIYSIDKLGSTKFVVKSHEKSISALIALSNKEKQIPKQLQQNYCELIQVNRKQVTIKSLQHNIQASIYEPQLTIPYLKDNKAQSNNSIPSNKKIKQNKQINYFDDKKQYQNCVILLHANSGSRLQGLQYIKNVLQYRSLCVTFDYSGSGISQGQYTTMGVNESKNLSSVLHYINQKYNVKKFALWGRSMGAVTGIYYILTKYQEDSKSFKVTSCVLDSPFCNLEKLSLQIASKKSNLLKIVLQHLVKTIEKDIINKVGVNIFEQLNLQQKIKKLNQQQRKLLHSVKFLGVVSKQDRMINHQHTEILIQLLVPQNVRNSDLLDQNKLKLQSYDDRHLMMLLEFKKSMNIKGDLMYITGDHNKPRLNQVKEKISLFIHESFFSYLVDNQHNKELDKVINFTKTGVKTKLSFLKGHQNVSRKQNQKKLQGNQMKSRKNSLKQDLIDEKQQAETNDFSFNHQNVNISIANQRKNQQYIQQQLNTRQNYNLINLKDIKNKQLPKKSISKEQLNTRYQNSLNRNSNKNGLNQGVKGLNVVSKQMQQQRNKLIAMSKGQELQSISINQNKQQSSSIQNKLIASNFQQNMSCNSFAININKSREIENTPNYKGISNNLKPPVKQIHNFSIESGSVNNSNMKDQNSQQHLSSNQEIIITPLSFVQSKNQINQVQNFTQRYLKVQNAKHRQDLTTQRHFRNIQTHSYVPSFKLINNNNINSIDTSPFNIPPAGIDKNSSFQLSITNQRQVNNAIKGKQLQGNINNVKGEVPKTPKMSLSQYRRDDYGMNNNKNRNSMKKQHVNNERILMNTTIDRILNNNIIQQKQQQHQKQKQKQKEKIIIQSFQDSMESETYSNKNSISSIPFQKRDLTETNSIKNSNISCDQSVQFTNYKPEPFKNQFNKKQQGNYHHNQNNSSANIISNKQIMFNGHKGMTQSTTFNSHINQYEQNNSNKYSLNNNNPQTNINTYHYKQIQTQHPYQYQDYHNLNNTFNTPQHHHTHNHYQNYQYSNPKNKFNINNETSCSTTSMQGVRYMKKSENNFMQRNKYLNVQNCYPISQSSFQSFSPVPSDHQHNIQYQMVYNSPVIDNSNGNNNNNNIVYAQAQSYQSFNQEMMCGLPRQQIQYKKKITKLLD